MKEFIGERQFFNIKKLWMIVLMVMGLFFVFAIPPLQAPDEIDHFVKSEALSNLDIIPIASENVNELKNDRQLSTWGKFGFYVDSDIKNLKDYSNSIAGEYREFSYRDLKLYLKSNPTGKKIFVSTEGITNYGLVNYLPQSLGIKISGLLTNSALIQYYWACLMNLLVYGLICLVSFNLFPFSKWIFVFASLNPMALYLAGSASGDAMTNALSFLFISSLLKMIMERKEQLTSHKSIISTGLLLVILIWMKPTNVCLGILYFLIPNKRLSVMKKILYGGAIMAISLTLYVKWNSLMIDQQLFYRDFADPSGQLALLLKNPLVFFKNFIRNFIVGNNGDFLISSFIGSFGRLNITIGSFWIFIYLAGWIISAVTDETSKVPVTIFFRITTLAAICGFIILTFFALYEIWNPVGYSNDISGVQGRYFIPISLILGMPVLNLLHVKTSPYKLNLCYLVTIVSVQLVVILRLITKYF